MPRKNSWDGIESTEFRIDDWPEGAIWKRRPVETDPAWMAFLTYLGLAPSKRTVRTAYAMADGLGKSVGHWYRWFSQHHWEDRIVAYERWNSDREIVKQEALAAEENAFWTGIRNDERRRGLKVGQALIEKAQAMLQFPLAEVERITSVYEDGRPKEVQVFKPAGWNFSTVARMVEVGSKLIQLTAQMDTERHNIDMRLIWDEADRVAKELKTDRETVLAMAEKIVEERWGVSDRDS